MSEQKFNVACPDCRKVYPISARMFGETMRCFNCGRAWKIAAPARKPTAPAPPAVVAPPSTGDTASLRRDRTVAGPVPKRLSPSVDAGGDSTVRRPAPRAPTPTAPARPGAAAGPAPTRATLHDDENSSIGLDYAVPDVQPLPVPIPIEQPSETIPDFAAAKPQPANAVRPGSGHNPVPSGCNAGTAGGAWPPPARAKGSGTAPVAVAAVAGIVVLAGLSAFLVLRRGGEAPKTVAKTDGATAPVAGAPSDGPVGVTLGSGERSPGDLFDDPPVRGGSGGGGPVGSGGPVEVDPLPPLTKRTEPLPKASPREPDPTPVEDEISKIGETFGRLTFALGDSMPRNPRKLLRECNAFLESLKRSRHPRAAEFRTEFEKALAKFNRDIAAGNAQLAELFQPEGIRRQLALLEGADAAGRKTIREDLLDVSDPAQVAVFYEELISNPKSAIRAECADIIAERKDPSGAAALFVALQTEQDATAKGAVLSALQRMTGRTLAADDINGWKNYFRSQS